MKYLVNTLILLSTLSCKTLQKDSEYFTVGYKGALKNMMHEGDISAKADLIDFKETPHFYALGAIENLKGEVQIFDSRPMLSVVQEGNLVFDNTYTKKATLLVYASVDKWKKIKIPARVVSYEQLEVFIGQAAEENHINIEEPFPFLIEGAVKSVDWHIINWKDGDMEHSHEKHVNSGLQGTINDREVEMLGFYSNKHHAVFTHHTTNMHIHFKTVENELAGHLDGLILGTGMLLKLPLVK